MMKNISQYMKMYTIAVTSTVVGLRQLLNTHIAAKSGAAAEEFKGSVAQINLKGSADLIITDGVTGDAQTLTAGTELLLPVTHALDRISISTATTGNLYLIIFYD